jgi:hypothetical protein
MKTPRNASPEIIDLIGGAEGDRTPGLRIANGENGVFMDNFLGLEIRHLLPKTLTKTQPRTRNRLLQITTFKDGF